MFIENGFPFFALSSGRSDIFRGEAPGAAPTGARSEEREVRML
jgi:hypothetical protein